jgi:cytoskeleton protein RodZ
MSDIGSTLREARMHARIDIIDVEQATKIRAKYLRAMEDEEWSVLPGPTYIKSFLRTYGDYLGLDSRALVDSYKREYERVSETELHPFGAGRRTRQAPREPGRWRPIVVVGAVLVAIIAALVIIGSTGGSDNNGVTPNKPASTTTAKKQGAAKAKKKTAAAPKTVKLQVVPTGTVYVCLVDGTGKKLIPGLTLTAGNSSKVFTARRFRITLGNAEAQLRLNGKLGPVPAASAGIGLEVTARGRKALAAGARPNCG